MNKLQTVDTSVSRPVVTGTDIKVSQIAREYAIHKMTSAEIVEAHPHLSLEQVCGAIAFYEDNQECIHSDWSDTDAFADRMRSLYPVSRS